MAHLFERSGAVCEPVDSTRTRHPALFRRSRDQAGVTTRAKRATTRSGLRSAFPKECGALARREAQSAIEVLARRRQTGWPAHSLRGQRLKDTDTVSREADRGAGEIGDP